MSIRLGVFMNHADVSLNFTRRRVSLLTILKGKN